MTVADYPDYTTPQAHADRISVTGAPPLVFKRVIDLQVGTSIAASGTLTRPASGQFNLNQPGYEININVGTLSANATPMSIELQWYDSAFGGLIDSETYYFFSGNANGHIIHGRGPSKGDQVIVIVKNFNSGAGVSFSYTLLQTSRTFTREFWKTVSKGGVQPVFPGFTAAASNIGGNILSYDSHAIAHSQALSVLLPMYTGTVRLFGTTTDTVAGNSQFTITAEADNLLPNATPFVGANGQSGFAPLGVGSLHAPDIALPRSQCALTLANQNTTTTQTLIAAILAQEDRA